MPPQKWAEDAEFGDQTPWLSTHLSDFIYAREQGKGPGYKNPYMDEFMNNNFKAFVAQFPGSFERQKLTKQCKLTKKTEPIPQDAPRPEREKAFIKVSASRDSEPA